jgi:hypothetical protein
MAEPHGLSRGSRKVHNIPENALDCSSWNMQNPIAAANARPQQADDTLPQQTAPNPQRHLSLRNAAAGRRFQEAWTQEPWI